MPSSARSRDTAFLILLVLAAVLTIATIHLVFFRAPIEAQDGLVQKVFYFHVPSAYAMYLGATACFVGSASYLFGATETRDAIARAGAEVAVAFGTIVMVTGPLWAVKAWGHYWTWDPRLTTALLSVLIYVSYVVLRAFGSNNDAEKKFAAALGFLGALNLPLIHFSVQKWSGQHPRVIGSGGLRHPDMQLALAFGMIAFTFLAIVLFWSRLRVALTQARLARAEQEALELGLGAED